jgi:hypothetical protein
MENPQKAEVTVYQLCPDGSEKRVSILTITEDEDDKDVCKAGYKAWLAATDKYADTMEYATCSRDFEGYLLGEIFLRSVTEV